MGKIIITMNSGNSFVIGYESKEDAYKSSNHITNLIRSEINFFEFIDIYGKQIIIKLNYVESIKVN